MNIQDSKREDKNQEEKVLVLRTLLEEPKISQRRLSQKLGISLGKINSLLQSCEKDGFLEKDRTVSQLGLEFLEPYKVSCALILASGFGSRFVPLTYETPKGLLEVFGERMIERQIRQLHEAGITDITIMVGYLKEKFEYLTDKYQVTLCYNPEYANKNTGATLWHARKICEGKNFYILSSDNWMRENMYHLYEPASWYSAVYMEGKTNEWVMHEGRKGILDRVEVGGENAWVMYGPVYFSAEFSQRFFPLLDASYHMPGTEQFYWEDVLMRNIRNLPPMHLNYQPEHQVYEFENLEELREFDPKYRNDSGSVAMQVVSEVFHMPESEIVKIRCLKAGMTNQSWLFAVGDQAEAHAGEEFICRIPGPGTDKLINRRQEASVYEKVGSLGITEDLIYFDPESGYKISKYYSGARNADPDQDSDLRLCMQMLRKLHNSKITLGHSFDIEERINYYEGLCKGFSRGVMFEDYGQVREKMQRVLEWLKTKNRPFTIAHVDSVADNFLFTNQGLKMIDWEYCGMADPLIDIGMCAIYSYMDFDKAETLLAHYCEEEGENIALSGSNQEEAMDIVTAYMGLGGFLWALWAVYKSLLGEEFGDYTIKMYRYAKDAYHLLCKKGVFKV